MRMPWASFKRRFRPGEPRPRERSCHPTSVDIPAPLSYRDDECPSDSAAHRLDALPNDHPS